MADPRDTVFLIEGGALRPLPARAFRAGVFGKTLEDALQTLLATFPEVLPGRDMEPQSADPPRFALLRREMPLAGWSVDHLLVDQRGVLTLVEAKLAENPEARREVIGQVMEYAAHARDRWGDGRARDYAEEFWTKRGQRLDDVLRQAFGGEFDVDSLWDLVEDNLRKGRIRLVIVADEVRAEVRRVIEYLNVEFTNAEIYGLELRCYGEAAGPMALVPRLIGQTQAAADRKAPSAGGVSWPAERLQAAYAGFTDERLRRALLDVLSWATDRGVFLPTVAKNPAFGVRSSAGRRLIGFYANGAIFYYSDVRVYAGGADERAKLAGALQHLGLLEPTFDPAESPAGTNLTKRLQELAPDELTRLLDLIGPFCQAPA